MTVAQFDGDNLIIKLTALGEYDAKSEIYSEWKRWAALSDNLKYPKAFDTVGGDELSPGQSIAPYFFCRNELGWRIETPDITGDEVKAKSDCLRFIVILCVPNTG